MCTHMHTDTHRHTNSVFRELPPPPPEEPEVEELHVGEAVQTDVQFPELSFIATYGFANTFWFVSA